MNAISTFDQNLDFLLTDIDDTLTDEGHLRAPAYQALWQLHEAGVQVVPVTGRPAGWCEMIARQWPVAGVIGENGAFYFRLKNSSMFRHYFYDVEIGKKNHQRLEKIREEVLSTIPGSAVASDQFCRLFDLAIDFCEDVPALSPAAVQKIVAVFQKHGAQAKVSSIHVNGWFGDYDKKTMAFEFLKREVQLSPAQALTVVGFAGDSPNDEPMFQAFPHSFAVANIKRFWDQLRHQPRYVADSAGGQGFTQIAQRICEIRGKPKRN
jgi:HAD superfamily hydrolase (TIGR01484 family)